METCDTGSIPAFRQMRMTVRRCLCGQYAVLFTMN